MPAISFKPQWLDDLLNFRKQQTTRPQTKRPEVGGKVAVYINQRSKIDTKPIRRLTAEGIEHYTKWWTPDKPVCPMHEGHPGLYYSGTANYYFTHLLGYVEVTKVYNFSPADFCHGDEGADFLESWARQDGFENFGGADTWFGKQYKNWEDITLTVIQWDGWLQRFFEGE